MAGGVCSKILPSGFQFSAHNITWERPPAGPGPRIFDDCVFWQPTRPQTPLALHVFLSALNRSAIPPSPAADPFESEMAVTDTPPPLRRCGVPGPPVDPQPPRGPQAGPVRAGAVPGGAAAAPALPPGHPCLPVCIRRPPPPRGLPSRRTSALPRHRTGPPPAQEGCLLGGRCVPIPKHPTGTLATARLGFFCFIFFSTNCCTEHASCLLTPPGGCRHPQFRPTSCNTTGGGGG